MRTPDADTATKATGQPTFLDLGWDVMRQRKEEGVRGISREWSRWRCHVATAPFATKDVGEIETVEIIDWTREMARKDCANTKEGKISRATIQRALSLVSAVMAEAVVRGLAKTNPCTGVKIKKRADENSIKPKWTFFTLDEERAIAACETIPEVARLPILFALYTGIRQGELCNLELVDLHVDGDSPEAFIQYGAPGHLPPKSGKTRRVPLIPQAVAVARRWLELLPTFAPSNPGGLAFPTANGKRRQQGKPLGRSGTFAAYLKLAGIEKHARWHDLRHGCASSLIGGWWGRRWPLQEVKVMLGHSSVTITERYAHLADTVLQDAARATVIVEELKPVAEPTMKGANDGADRKRVFARGSEYVRKHLDNTGALKRIASRLESAARSATSFARKVAGKVKDVRHAA